MTATIVAKVSRSLLGLPDLDINDHLNYILAVPIFGGTQTWRRDQAASPFVDGAFTVSRARDNVEMNFAVDVLGGSQVTMANNIRALVEAFSQDDFTISVQLDAQPYAYQAEAADYTMDFSRERMHALQAQVTFRTQCRPIAIAGPMDGQ